MVIDMSIDDLLSLTPKFWQLHHDPAVLLDGGAITLLTIQYNLCAGTIARYAGRRPELVPLVEDLLQYRKQYVLLPFRGTLSSHVSCRIIVSVVST